MVEGNGHSKTHQRILALLADGMAHPRREIHACLDDELSSLSAIRYHICMIRKSLRLRGEEIVCELNNNRLCYRHVRLISR